MRAPLKTRVAGIVVAAFVAGPVVAGPGPDHHRSQALWASPTGSGTACTAAAPCSLGYAIDGAPSGATVRAQSGTYHTSIIIYTPLNLVGEGNVVLDASTSGLVPGIQILASGSSVSHLTVENAYYEGILVGNSSSDASGSPIIDVTIDHVTVRGSDAGYNGSPGAGTGECFTATSPHAAPGDCGEGIHLNSAKYSVVEHSRVEGNAGGILLTDEFGANSNNHIAYNIVVNNTHDCGITLASHNEPGVAPPTSYGVFDNTVEYNMVDGNGVEGQGGGILMAGGGPNTQVYGNKVTHNQASGNGLAGVVIHLHVPGSNLNDNVITYNRLSNNNLDGDDDFSPNVDSRTTDILVASTVPLQGTVIEHNQLSDAYYGVWLLNATDSTIGHNQFSNVTTGIGP